VDPATLDRCGRVTLWHLAVDEEMDRFFPEARRKAGGYALVGGGAAVGNSALCLAYVMGFRRFELYGYDSSHRGEESHAYEQPMNRFIPVVDVEWGGQNYRASVAMKAQAEKFQITAQALKREGCTIHVHGDGLLPAMWNTPPVTECDKYRLLWSTDAYREHSPGEGMVPAILKLLEPEGLVLDFGCGTGRAALELAKAGCDVLCIDFADNCRDEEAMALPFLQWDLTKPIPARAKFGVCTDVMEHIPPDDVATVLANVLGSAESVFFQISTVPDALGALIGQDLHLTVRPHGWWTERLAEVGVVTWDHDMGHASLFIVRRKTQ
jgi:SAM-dependent methyltransferase